MTNIYYRFNGPEQIIEFVRWTPAFLILRYPPASLSAGKLWKIGRKAAEKWINQGVLRFEENGQG